MKISQSTAVLALLALAGCSTPSETKSKDTPKDAGIKPYAKVDPKTAGVLTGRIRFAGRKPPRKLIDMSEDPACAEARHGRTYEEPVVVNPNGTLANAFVYIKTGLEASRFEAPSMPVIMDQRGCSFHPRLIGIQTGQPLQITNSDPVTHNVHPV